MVTFHDVLSTRCRLLLGHPPVDPPRLLHLLPPLGTFKKLHYELGLSGPVIEHATDVLHIGLVLAIREYSSRATVLETRPVVVRLPPRPLVRIPVRGGQQWAISRWSPGVFMLQYRVVLNRYPPLDYPPYPPYPIQGTFVGIGRPEYFSPLREVQSNTEKASVHSIHDPDKRNRRDESSWFLIEF